MTSKLLVEINNLEQALEFVNAGVDALILNVNGLASKKQFNIYTDELAILASKKGNTQLFINMDKLYHEDDFVGLKTLLSKIYDLGIRDLIISDIGIYTFCKMYHLDFNFYNGNAILNTNYSSIEFMSRYFNGFVLSNEIHINETLEILKHSSSQNIVQVYGKAKMFYSNRKLLSSYFNYTKLDFSNNEAYIIENDSGNKEDMTYFYEDENGSYAYTYYSIDGSSYIKQLNDNGLGYAYLNNIFEDEDAYNKIVLAYNQYFKGNIDLKQLQETIYKNNQNISLSFFEDQTIFTIEDAKLLEGSAKHE